MISGLDRKARTSSLKLNFSPKKEIPTAQEYPRKLSKEVKDA